MNNLAIQYEQDFYLWLCNNIELLKQGRLSEIDAENIAEELEGMSKNQKREIINRLKILFAHLLKWQFQPDRRSNSWKGTIVEQRNQISKLFKESPSLKYQIDKKITDAYTEAREYASFETGILESDFPSESPYSLIQALDKNFYPD